MATGPATDGESAGIGGLPPVRSVGRALLSSLVSRPGRTTAALLVAGPYLWLGYYIVGTATGRLADPIVGGDWLTLLFISYALVSPLALAHRILRVGVTELTVEYLLDATVLTWLTAFYFVWMLAREPVSPTTTVRELYAPVLAGDPNAILWAGTVAVVATVVAGTILFPRADSRPFKNSFRAALVTYPTLVAGLVLVFRPGADSLLWPVVIGVSLGTLAGGVGRIHVIVTALARGLFASLSLFVWAVGALGWVFVYRRRPPTTHVVFDHSVWADGDNWTEEDGPTGGSEAPDGDGPTGGSEAPDGDGPTDGDGGGRPK